MNLPNGNGKKIKVAVLCEEGKISEAKESGADMFGSENIINEINNEKINFDKIINKKPKVNISQNICETQNSGLSCGMPPLSALCVLKANTKEKIKI